MSDSIEISVNGVSSTIRKETMVENFLRRENVEGRFLVVLNDEIVPKSAYESTQLNTGDRLDIMSPISGG